MKKAVKLAVGGTAILVGLASVDRQLCACVPVHFSFALKTGADPMQVSPELARSRTLAVLPLGSSREAVEVFVAQIFYPSKACSRTSTALDCRANASENFWRKSGFEFHATFDREGKLSDIQISTFS